MSPSKKFIKTLPQKKLLIHSFTAASKIYSFIHTIDTNTRLVKRLRQWMYTRGFFSRSDNIPPRERKRHVSGKNKNSILRHFSLIICTLKYLLASSLFFWVYMTHNVSIHACNFLCNGCNWNIELHFENLIFSLLYIFLHFL